MKRRIHRNQQRRFKGQRGSTFHIHLPSRRKGNLPKSHPYHYCGLCGCAMQRFKNADPLPDLISEE